MPWNHLPTTETNTGSPEFRAVIEELVEAHDERARVVVGLRDRSPIDGSAPVFFRDRRVFFFAPPGVRQDPSDPLFTVQHPSILDALTAVLTELPMVEPGDYHGAREIRVRRPTEGAREFVREVSARHDFGWPRSVANVQVRFGLHNWAPLPVEVGQRARVVRQGSRPVNAEGVTHRWDGSTWIPDPGSAPDHFVRDLDASSADGPQPRGGPSPLLTTARINHMFRELDGARHFAAPTVVEIAVSTIGPDPSVESNRLADQVQGMRDQLASAPPPTPFTEPGAVRFGFGPFDWGDGPRPISSFGFGQPVDPEREIDRPQAFVGRLRMALSHRPRGTRDPLTLTDGPDFFGLDFEADGMGYYMAAINVGGSPSYAVGPDPEADRSFRLDSSGLVDRDSYFNFDNTLIPAAEHENRWNTITTTTQTGVPTEWIGSLSEFPAGHLGPDLPHYHTHHFGVDYVRSVMIARFDVDGGFSKVT